MEGTFCFFRVCAACSSLDLQCSVLHAYLQRPSYSCNVPCANVLHRLSCSRLAVPCCSAFFVLILSSLIVPCRSTSSVRVVPLLCSRQSHRRDLSSPTLLNTVVSFCTTPRLHFLPRPFILLCLASLRSTLIALPFGSDLPYSFGLEICNTGSTLVDLDSKDLQKPVSFKINRHL